LVLGRRPLGAILHSSNEPGELSQWLCHNDSTIIIVLDIIIIIIPWYTGHQLRRPTIYAITLNISVSDLADHGAFKLVAYLRLANTLTYLIAVGKCQRCCHEIDVWMQCRRRRVRFVWTSAVSSLFVGGQV